jgi:hypothetical protein
LAAAVGAFLFARAATGQSIRGTIVDSASGKGVAGARVSVTGTSLQATADALGRFTIAGVPAGEHMLAIHTASLDSMSAGYSAAVTVAQETTTFAVRVPNALQIAAGACGDAGFGDGGILLGKLRVDGDSTAALSGTVSAEWRAGASGDARAVSGRSDARGRFALCGVALGVPLTVRALTDSASGQASELRVPAAARFARAELVLRKEAANTGILIGVVTDSANQPMSGVEVSFPELSKSALTSADGAFALQGIEPGLKHLIARRVGYGPVDAQIAIEAGRTARRRIQMTRATSLDSVVVTEKAIDHALGDFEENRKLGLGHFITRAELAKQEGRSAAAVLTTMPGIKVFTAGSYAWVGSGRHGATSIGGSGVGLDDSDALKGAPAWDCYALVYIDDHVVWRGRTFPPQSRRERQFAAVWEPLFDINSMAVAQIEAIEYYASAAEAPIKYATLNSQCGILVIHTIRYHPTDTTATKKPPTD